MMESVNPDVNALHQAFCNVSGQELPLLPSWERGWLEAHTYGVTPDDVVRVFKQRKIDVQLGERKKGSLYPRAFCGTDDAIASVVEESAAIKSRSRMHLVDASRQSILRQTGREEKATEMPAKQVGNVSLIEQLKRAAE